MPNDVLLVIDGVPGESKDSKHPGAIDVASFSWGETNSGTFAYGTGGGAGKVSFHDFAFTMKVNKASARLAQACMSGIHFPRAQLFVRKQGEQQRDFYVVTLEDFIVSSFQSGGPGNGELVPLDKVTLNFSKIKFEYRPQKADGTLEPPITGGWNLKQNKKQ